MKCDICDKEKESTKDRNENPALDPLNTCDTCYKVVLNFAKLDTQPKMMVIPRR